VPIADDTLKARFESKRDADLEDIYARIAQVEVERAYRIIGSLDQTAQDIEERSMPLVTEALRRWRRRTAWGDILLLGGTAAAVTVLGAESGAPVGAGLVDFWQTNPVAAWIGALLLLILVLLVHMGVRSVAARSLVRWLKRQGAQRGVCGDVAAAFLRSASLWRSMFFKSPAGWGNRSRRRLHGIREGAKELIQSLNDRFTRPSGRDAEGGSRPQP